jgi:hypothetical protein
MGLPAEKLSTLLALRGRIAERFRGTVPEGSEPPLPGAALASGWSAVDAHLPLRAGDTVLVHAAPGAGSLALASSWARAAMMEGEPALVIDAQGSSLPHPWVAPEGAQAPCWVVVPSLAAEAWPAADIGLRSGAFGLVVLLDPPPPPRRAGARLVHLARTHRARLVLTRSRPWASSEGFPPRPHLHLHAPHIEWIEAPTGAAPITHPTFHVCTDRLRPTPRAPDRRPSHGRGRDRYES